MTERWTRPVKIVARAGLHFDNAEELEEARKWTRKAVRARTLETLTRLNRLTKGIVLTHPPDCNCPGCDPIPKGSP
jgi:hypothetical protein